MADDLVVRAAEAIKLWRKATAGPWRAMREGNQYLANGGIIVGASRVDGLPRPWNPRYVVPASELEEVSRFRDEDADFIAHADAHYAEIARAYLAVVAERDTLDRALGMATDDVNGCMGNIERLRAQLAASEAARGIARADALREAAASIRAIPWRDAHIMDSVKFAEHIEALASEPTAAPLTETKEAGEMSEDIVFLLRNSAAGHPIPLPPRVLILAADEIERLRALINSPQTDDFLEAVRIEAAHQVERWGEDHDARKIPDDWLWALAFLSTKATQAARYGDREKYLHHIITCAAACLNWHRHAKKTPLTETEAWARLQSGEPGEEGRGEQIPQEAGCDRGHAMDGR